MCGLSVFLSITPHAIPCTSWLFRNEIRSFVGDNMLLHQPNVDALIESMTPSADEIQSRKDFLEFSERDSELLKELGKLLAPLEDVFADLLSEHLDAHPVVAASHIHPDQLSQLKQKQRGYFKQIFTGDYGPGYIKSRLRVGVTYQQLGLEPRWHLSAYSKYLSWVLPEVMRLVDNDAERFLAYSKAITKIAMFDSELSVSAYFHADHQMLRLLAQVFESNLEAVIIADVKGNMLHVNKSVAKITGYPPDALIGKPMQNLLAELEPTLYQDLWTTVIGGGQWQGEIWLRNQQGEDYLAWMNMNAVKDDAGKVTQVIAEFSDITAFKQTQEALAKRTEELANSNRELEQFAYVASHDLQEPLRMVASYTQLLARRYKDKLDDDANEFIGYAVDGATRMQALIIDLLTMSRIGTHGKQMEACETSVALERAISNLRLAIEESGAVVTRDPMPRLDADVSQLTQLFQNLIGNGIKFRGDTSPIIHIGAEKKEGEWLFSVRDNGIGIAPDFFDRIFIIFQRLHGKHEYPGTGIGLSVCKKIVERHRGKIWIESEVGKGTVFYFTLPINHRERKHHGE